MGPQGFYFWGPRQNFGVRDSKFGVPAGHWLELFFDRAIVPRETYKRSGSGGSMVAKLKLKGIDGRAPPGVEPAA